MDKDIPDWASIERQAEAVAFSDMMEAADLEAQEASEALAAVSNACRAIEQARLTHIGVRVMLTTLARSMESAGRFSAIESASIEDTASDF
jgi:hypothetical protein